MSSDLGLLLASILLVIATAFFVAAEYSLVSVRRTRVEQEAKKGNKTAKILLEAITDLSPYVAGVQIAITMLGIGVGSITEPYVSHLLSHQLTQLPAGFRTGISILIVTYFTVVIGELVPKYWSLHRADEVARFTIRPLRLFVTLLRPLVVVVQASGAFLLKAVNIRLEDQKDETVPKEELLMLVRSGGASGVLEKQHAEMVTRALRLDLLDAQDIMVHRLDVKWLDVSLTRAQVMQKLKAIPYHRIPICRGDIDDMIGIAYLHDIVINLDSPNFTLAAIARPVVAVPENLSMEKIIETMRVEKTQMLVVMDEYGGTSGIVTLEDVVEEVFGELEDRLESERPVVESFPGGRVSARAEVRFDELIHRLSLDLDPGDVTDTLATMVVDRLDRVPRPGDCVETDLGQVRVENMARRRITRVSIQLAPTLVPESYASNDPPSAP